VRICRFLIGVLIVAAHVKAQVPSSESTELVFDAVSIRRVTDFSEVDRKKGPPQGCHGSDSATSSDPLSNTSVPMARCVFHFITPKTLFIRVFRLQPPQVSGGPAWLNSDFYEIHAKAADPATVEQLRGMLQTLFRQQFALQYHHQSKEVDGYELVVSKSGPKLKTADANKPAKLQSGRPMAERSMMVINAQSADMNMFVLNLNSQSAGRIVVDKTGLTGIYDFTLRWEPDGDASVSSNRSGPSLFTALQEQLGLRLQPRKVRVELFVIDRLERP